MTSDVKVSYSDSVMPKENSVNDSRKIKDNIAGISQTPKLMNKKILTDLDKSYAEYKQASMTYGLSKRKKHIESMVKKFTKLDFDSNHDSDFVNKLTAIVSSFQNSKKNIDDSKAGIFKIYAQDGDKKIFLVPLDSAENILNNLDLFRKVLNDCQEHLLDINKEITQGASTKDYKRNFIMLKESFENKVENLIYEKKITKEEEEEQLERLKSPISLTLNELIYMIYRSENHDEKDQDKEEN